jgi:hypothetical protein
MEGSQVHVPLVSLFCYSYFSHIFSKRTTLDIATIRFFVAICTTLLQHNWLLHRTKHIRCKIYMLSQQVYKELQYHLCIASLIKLFTTQLKSWQQ